MSFREPTAASQLKRATPKQPGRAGPSPSPASHRFNALVRNSQAAAQHTRGLHLRKLDFLQQADPVHFGVVSRKVARPYMEDAWNVVTNLHALNGAKDDAPPTHFFGVFDGHAGRRCSSCLSTDLAPALRANEEFATDLRKACEGACRAVDGAFLQRATKGRMLDGSTAVCVLLRGNTVVCMNVGDSRAIVVSAHGSFTALSVDHKPNREDERERIAKAGGKVIKVRGVFRVDGHLAMSRAFGNVLTKPPISAEPEFKSHELDDEDRFVVIASDGLWDVMSNADVAQALKDFDDAALYDAALHLVELAKSKKSGDNTTVLVVGLRGYIERLRAAEQQQQQQQQREGEEEDGHVAAPAASFP